MIVAMIALFVALGGTAAALEGSNTVFSDDIVNGAVRYLDLDENASARKIEFGSTGGDITKVLQLANLELTVYCFRHAGNPGRISDLQLTAKNISGQTGQLNASWAWWTSDNSNNRAVEIVDGAVLSAGSEEDLNTPPASDAGIQFLLSALQPEFERADGEIMLRTPGRVTTVNFHGGANQGCEFFGTAVTATRP
jgi:hypothetical protein